MSIKPPKFRGLIRLTTHSTFCSYQNCIFLKVSFNFYLPKS